MFLHVSHNDARRLACDSRFRVFGKATWFEKATWFSEKLAQDLLQRGFKVNTVNVLFQTPVISSEFIISLLDFNLKF